MDGSRSDPAEIVVGYMDDYGQQKYLSDRRYEIMTENKTFRPIKKKDLRFLSIRPAEAVDQGDTIDLNFSVDGDVNNNISAYFQVDKVKAKSVICLSNPDYIYGNALRLRLNAQKEVSKNNAGNNNPAHYMSVDHAKDIVGISGLISAFEAGSYDTSSRKWKNTSDSETGKDSTWVVNDPKVVEDGLNGWPVLQGGVGDAIVFNKLPSEYTLFHVSRYTPGGNKGAIFKGLHDGFAIQWHDPKEEHVWLSGFDDGKTGVAYRFGEWISEDDTNEEWVVSTDMKDMYRSNGMTRGIRNSSEGEENENPILSINWMSRADTNTHTQYT